MAFVPQFKIYDNTGLNLIWTFEKIQLTNSPQDPQANVIHKITRGKGAIVIDGGQEAWELEIEGILGANDYEALVVKMDAMTSAIVKFTPYILKIDKTVSTTYEHKVKRILPIQWGETNYRNDYIFYRIILLVHSW